MTSFSSFSWFQLYEGCRHEIDKELEEDAARCVTEIEEWIVKRLPAQNKDEVSTEEATTTETADTEATTEGKTDEVDTVGIEAVQPEVTAE